MYESVPVLPRKDIKTFEADDVLYRSDNDDDDDDDDDVDDDDGGDGGGVHEVEEKNGDEKEADEDDGGGVGENGDGNGKRDVNEIDFINNRMPPKKKKRHSLDAEQKKLRDKQKHPLTTHVCKHKEPIDKSLRRCNEIDELTRVYTHSQFWEGSSDCRRNWINHMVEEKEPERRRKIKTKLREE